MINQAQGSSLQRPASPQPPLTRLWPPLFITGHPPFLLWFHCSYHPPNPPTPVQTVSVVLQPSHLGLHSGGRFRTDPGADELPRPDCSCPWGAVGLGFSGQLGLAQRQHPGAAGDGGPGLEKDGRANGAEGSLPSYRPAFISM